MARNSIQNAKNARRIVEDAKRIASLEAEIQVWREDGRTSEENGDHVLVMRINTYGVVRDVSHWQFCVLVTGLRIARSITSMLRISGVPDVLHTVRSFLLAAKQDAKNS